MVFCATAARRWGWLKACNRYSRASWAASILTALRPWPINLWEDPARPLNAGVAVGVVHLQHFSLISARNFSVEQISHGGCAVSSRRKPVCGKLSCRMEDSVSSSRSNRRTLAELASSLAAGRARAQQSLAEQRTRLREFDERVTQELDQITTELRVEREEVEQQETLLLSQAATLEQQQRQLNAEQDEWERLQDEATSQQQELAEFLQKQQDELNQRENLLDAEEAQLRQVQSSLDASQRELDEQVEQLSHVRKRVDEKLLTLEKDREQVDGLAQETKSQRRRIARQLLEQKSEQTRALAQEWELLQKQQAALATERALFEKQQAEASGLSASAQAELDQLAAERDSMAAQRDSMAAERDSALAKLAKVGAEFASHKSEYAQAKTAHVAELAQLIETQTALEQVRTEWSTAQVGWAETQAELVQALEAAQAELAAAIAQSEAATAEAQAVLQKRLAEADRKFNLAADEARELRRRNAELEEQLAQRPEGPNAAEVAQILRLTEERDSLTERLADAEARAKKGAAPADIQQKLQDLQRRFELAVEDVRELKTANSDLEKQLRTAKNAARPADTPSGGNLNWEAQKKKLLAALESEVDEDDEDSQRKRLSIEGTIQITDEVIADKQREIDELQQLLESQSSQMGGMAVGAAAIAATLDQDELIQNERRRLAELQVEWEEKLRRAEIDISVERAKMARERAALEEQLAEANFQQKSTAAATMPDKPDEKGKKATGGRWLARLGLKDGGEEKSS